MQQQNFINIKNQETARCLTISFRSKPLHGMEIKPDFHLGEAYIKNKIYLHMHYSSKYIKLNHEGIFFF